MKTKNIIFAFLLAYSLTFQSCITPTSPMYRQENITIDGESDTMAVEYIDEGVITVRLSKGAQYGYTNMITGILGGLTVGGGIGLAVAADQSSKSYKRGAFWDTLAYMTGAGFLLGAGGALLFATAFPHYTGAEYVEVKIVSASGTEFAYDQVGKGMNDIKFHTPKKDIQTISLRKIPKEEYKMKIQKDFTVIDSNQTSKPQTQQQVTLIDVEPPQTPQEEPA